VDESEVQAGGRDGHDTAHPDERTTNAEGNAEFPAPPRVYCAYAPV
jgi:alpha-amylase